MVWFLFRPIYFEEENNLPGKQWVTLQAESKIIQSCRMSALIETGECSASQAYSSFTSDCAVLLLCCCTIVVPLLLQVSYKWCNGGVTEGHLAATCYCWPISSHHVEPVEGGKPVCRAILRKLFFFTNLTWIRGQPKYTHANIHTHARVNTWLPKWPAMVVESNNTSSPPPLLCSSLLFSLSYFLHSVFSTNCFLSARKPDLHSTGCFRGFLMCRACGIHFLKNWTAHLKAEITKRDRQLRSGCLCSVLRDYNAGRDCR